MSTSRTEADARIVIDDLLGAAGWNPADKPQVRTEVSTAFADTEPQLLDRSEEKYFDKHAPVIDLVAAGGAFGPDQEVAAEPLGWLPVPDHIRLTRDHFIAKVSGRSMEPTIPDGSYCLFRFERGGSRNGKLVLVWHRGCSAPALGGEYSVKRYRSEKVTGKDRSWSHSKIRLEPLNPDPAFQSLTFSTEDEGDVRVVVEFVAVVTPATSQPKTGRADYVLCDQRGRPLAVIEAKKQAIHPYIVKQQALPYAKELGAPFIFLTNGELIYFWDYQNDDARIVGSFFSRRDLERLPAGVTLTFKRWAERANGEKFHNRYLLSDIGGVIIGVGLDAGSTSQTDDVNLMDAVPFLKRWGQFNGACAFDLVGEPKAVVGAKT